MPKVTEGAAKLEQAPRAGLCFTREKPLQHAPDKRMSPMPSNHMHSIEQPLIRQTVCWVRPPPGGLTQPCPPHPALWAQAFAAQGSERLGDGSGGHERGTGRKNHNRMKNSRGWADGLGDNQKRDCLHTGIFLHTLVHTPRYSTCKNICYSHTRLLQGPREPVVAALVGFG